MAAHRAPAFQASAMVADEESSGHTSYESEDDYMLGILEEAYTRQWDDLSTVPQEGSDASESNESLADMAGMARIPEGDETSETRFPEGDENDALSSHPSSAEENKNEEPACEANRCRCPMGLPLRGRRGLLLL